MVQTFDVELKDMEVRKVEEVEMEIGENTYRYLNVNFDNEAGDRLVFKDKIMDHKENYTRGKIGKLTLTISTEPTTKTAKNGKAYITEKTTILIKDFK